MADVIFISRDRLAGIIGRTEENKIGDAFRGVAIELPIEVPEPLPDYLEALEAESVVALLAVLGGQWVCLQCKTDEYHKQGILDWVSRGEGLTRTAMAFGISEWDVKRFVSGKIDF